MNARQSHCGKLFQESGLLEDDDINNFLVLISLLSTELKLSQRQQQRFNQGRYLQLKLPSNKLFYPSDAFL